MISATPDLKESNSYHVNTSHASKATTGGVVEGGEVRDIKGDKGRDRKGGMGMRGKEGRRKVSVEIKKF